MEPMDEPTIEEIDTVLGYLSELVKDPRLNPRRRKLITDSIDDLLDVRSHATSHSSSLNLNYVASLL